MVPAVRLGSLPLLLLLAGVQSAAVQAAAQSPPVQSPAAPAGLLSQDAPQAATSTTTDPAQTAPALPSDLARIKQGVMSPRSLTLIDRDTMRIYVNTIAPFPKFTDIVGSFDLMHGAVPGSGMTHQDFLQMSRPKDMYSSAGFTPGDVLRFAALGYVEGKAFELMRKGALALRDAKTEAERKAIQARIDKELAALKGEIK